MKATYSQLISSRFYNPAFNSAIFDGPIRIYFAQFHESLALKIYFGLQQKFPQALEMAKNRFKKDGCNVLVMLYPSAEAFRLSFDGRQNEGTDGRQDFLVEDRLGADTLVGINGPFEDSQLHEVLNQIALSIDKWCEEPLERPAIGMEI
jgi:hypothetical protein